MRWVLDAGAFLALERGDRSAWTRIKATQGKQATPITHGGVVAQVWRGGVARQALLAKAMKGIEVLPLDREAGQQAGLLLAKTGMVDAIDASVVAIAQQGDSIMTSDSGDIESLVQASGRRIDVVSV